MAGGGGEEVAKILRPIVVGWANFFLAYFFGGAIFFKRIILKTFFHESGITCIITVVGAQQQHKGMFLKTWSRRGGGAKIFQQCNGGGNRFFPRVFERRGGAFFSAY